MPLAKRTDYGDAKYAGVQLTSFTQDVPAAVQNHMLCGFDFVVAPLTRPDYRPPRGGADGGKLVAPFRKEDVLYLDSSQYVNQVVGAVSTWIDCDSPDPQLRQDSVAALRAQLTWAAHLGLQAVLLPPPPQPLNVANYAQVINQALAGLTHMAVWMTVDLASGPIPGFSGTEGTNANVNTGAQQQQQQAAECAAEAVSSGAGVDPWESWNVLRTLCESHNLLGVALALPPTLPTLAAPGPAGQPQHPSLARWLGEPVKALLVGTGVFGSNKRGYPVLSRPHQDFISHFFKHNVQVVVTAEPKHAVPAPASAATAPPGSKQVSVDGPLGFSIEDPGETHPMRAYWEYMCYLFRKLHVLTDQDKLEGSYRDYLQAPLQPLQDNLESQTYEVFEKDVMKYELYSEAVYRALLDKRGAAGSSTGSTSGTADGADGSGEASTSGSDKQRPVVLMVVGAGRGPLVRASMKAAARAGVPLRVYAVEKNPNALIHIEAMLAREGWQDQVTIVSADMRHWQAPEQAEILVSELLGSFGDNELSPECLDGAQRFLAPGAVSIPQSYTSFLAPVTTHKLHHDCRNYKDLDHLETPYVVKFHRCNLLAHPQPFFTFTHPSATPNPDNSRYHAATFARDPSAGGALLHGFAGYFESVLYSSPAQGTVLLSIHPDTHSPNMFSWFPIYFPIREPLYVPPGAEVSVQMWRCCAPHKVWYEWSVTRPVATPIHNVGGRSYYVGL